MRSRDVPLLLVVAVLAVVGCSGGGVLITSCHACPCPPNSVFMHDTSRNIAVCVCAPGLSCRGPECMFGHPLNTPSFQSYDVGFPFDCTSCSCTSDEETDETQDTGAPRVNSRSGLDRSGKIVAVDEPRSRLKYRDYVDPVFEKRCKEWAGPITVAPVPLVNASWLHIPKCGSSFTSTVYNYFCQSTTESLRVTYPAHDVFSLYYPRTCRFCYQRCEPNTRCFGFSSWAPHNGIGSYLSVVETKMCVGAIHGVVNTHGSVHGAILAKGVKYITMMRNPLTRLMSAYNHDRHAFGLRNRPAMVEETTSWSLKQWANYPGISGCQTKMVLGMACANEVHLTDDHLDQAKRLIVDHFAFVGLVGYWDLSICLFHRMFGSRIDIKELANLRPHAGERDVRRAKDEDLRALGVEDDPIDFALYLFVRDLFVQRLRRYGFHVPASLANPPTIYD